MLEQTSKIPHTIWGHRHNALKALDADWLIGHLSCKEPYRNNNDLNFNRYSKDRGSVRLARCSGYGGLRLLVRDQTATVVVWMEDWKCKSDDEILSLPSSSSSASPDIQGLKGLAGSMHDVNN